MAGGFEAVELFVVRAEIIHLGDTDGMPRSDATTHIELIEGHLVAASLDGRTTDLDERRAEAR